MNMKRPVVLFFLLSLSLEVFGASQATDYINAEPSQPLKALKLPQEVIAEIEKNYLQEFKKQQPVQAEGMADSEIMSQLKRRALQLKVRMKPVETAVLPQPLVFNMPLGGGEIVLSDHIQDQYPGRFKLFIDVATTEAQTAELLNNTLKVFYVSQAKRRKIKGTTLGAGCFKYADITKSYKESIKNEGLLLDTMDSAHVSALSGTFVFVSVEAEHLNLGAIKFTDNHGLRHICAE